MIEKLFIKNYLIIKEAEINFSEGLNILTGETGAGKSVIIDAMSMILGERADYSLINKDADKLTVEGHFNFKKNKNISNILKEFTNDVNADPENIILRRELYRKGTSRNFINDSPVNISEMKSFGDKIIDIHSQNEHQSLLNRETHTEILDSFIDRNELFFQYRKEFELFKNLIRNYEELSSKKDELVSKRSFLDFQLKEINNLNLSPDEDKIIETELNKLENIETISTALENSLKSLFENDVNALSEISISLKELKKIEGFDDIIEKIGEDLYNAYILVNESTESLRKYRSDLNFDNVKTEQLRERLSSIERIKRKYGMTVNELIEKALSLGEELNFAENFDYEIEQLLKKTEIQKNEVVKLTKNISELRLKKSKDLEKAINRILKEIGLESAEFKVDIKNITGSENDFYSFESGSEYIRTSINGCNETEFLIKTNKGLDYSPLRKSASGGEISRIMLAIKTVLSEKDKIPVLVFDEIDAGISGRVAQKAGKMLHSLSKTHQIICITHLPQIAALSDRHFHVSKKDESGKTTAVIDMLSKDEKIMEVAKLISGEKVTESATRSAEELING